MTSGTIQKLRLKINLTLMLMNTFAYSHFLNKLLFVLNPLGLYRCSDSMDKTYRRHSLRNRLLRNSVFEIMLSRYLAIRNQGNDTENQTTTDRNGAIDTKRGDGGATVTTGELNDDTKSRSNRNQQTLLCKCSFVYF